MIGYININSLRGDKFRLIKDFLIETPFNILCIDETKLSHEFTDAQFEIEGYQFPNYRRDRLSTNTRSFGGGKMVFVKDGMINKRLDSYETKNAETICIELTISNRKWFIMFAYRPESIDRALFFTEVKDSLTKAFANYEYVLLAGDLNVDMDIPKTDTKGYLSDLIDLFDLTNIVKGKTCFQKTGGSSLDVMLTNHPLCFQSTRVLETGFSDHHCMVFTFLKSRFQKLPPKQIKYRDMKNFDESKYIADIKDIDFYSISTADNEYHELTLAVQKVIDKHAPLKTKFVRGNNAPFVTKEMRKAIMNRSRHKNNYNKWKSRENFLKLENSIKEVKVQTEKAKRDYFSKASEDGVMTNRTFWKTMKPLMTNKGVMSSGTIIIEENGVLVSDEKELVNIFNDHYINIVENTIGRKPVQLGDPLDPSCDEGTVQKIIEEYKNNPLIIKIKENFNSLNTFSLKPITKIKVREIIKDLDVGKSIGSDNIPAKFIKIASEHLEDPITSMINNSINKNRYCEDAKTAVIPPIFKKKDRTVKENYRPVSVLKVFSKIFEKHLKDTLQPHVDKILSRFISAYRKYYSTNHVLISVLEGWKKQLDSGKFVGTVLMDLSKAFDCVPHDLLIAKLWAYGFDDNALTFFYSYLKRRKQCVKINNFFSSFQVLLSGVPQGSILGPILFNIFINDLYLWIQNSDLANYADDNTISASANSIQDLLKILESESEIAIEWFEGNDMIANADKFQSMIINKCGRHNDLQKLKIGDFEITSKESVELLGMKIDNKLNFNKHIGELCKKAAGQLNTICRYNKYIGFKEKKALTESFVQSNFNYCPLVWMFTSPKSTRKIERIQERALRLLIDDYHSSYSELLAKSKKQSVSIRMHQILASEVYKTLNGYNPSYMNDIFIKNSRENSRFPNNLRKQGYRGITYGKNSLREMAPDIWNNLAEELKTAPNLCIFKNLIKTWTEFNCSCRMCEVMGNNKNYQDIEI